MDYVTINIGSPEKVTLKISGGGGSYEPYMGNYTVLPKPFEETVLLTKEKVMTDNVRVLEIPFAQVSNPQGCKTTTIGVPIIV